MLIDHINISAPADLLRRVKDFYCDILGLTDGFRPEFPKNGYWLYSDDKPIIHLVESNDHHRNDQQGFFDHFALQSKGVAGVLEKLNRAGIDCRTSYIPEIGLSQIFCKDPSGTGVELNFLNETL